MKLAALFVALLACGAAAAPDEDALGKRQGYPLCARASFLVDANCVISMVSRVDEIYESRRVPNGESASVLGRADKEPAITFSHRNVTYTLDEYLARNRTTGLLVLKGDTILVERYQYERTARHRMNSYSMAKTVVAMLVGLAVADGAIRSLDDKVETYVPQLKGQPLGETPIRHVLTMSSGVKFTTNDSGADDLALLTRLTLLQEGEGGPASVQPFKERERPPGVQYFYSSLDTQVLGLVVRGATGRNLSDYLSERIWRPMGAESHATWLTDRSGHEVAFAFLQATLRDWGRFGLLLANDGAAGGRQLIPAAWVREATTVSAPHLRAGRAERFFGYGYQVRVLPGANRQFVLIGQRGQALYVDPARKIVMVHTAARPPNDVDGTLTTLSLWHGVVRSVSNL